MNIAIISPAYLPIPPKKYGGTERVIQYLIQGLMELGHHVILLAPGDSQVDCELIPIIDKSTGYGKDAYEDLNLKPLRDAASKKALEELERNRDRIDIIHSHGVDLTQFADRPHLFTLHLEIVLSDINKSRELRYFNQRRDMFYNTISYNALETSQNLNVVGTIYNGLDPQEYPLNTKPQDYLAYLGRFSFDKGPHLAMELAAMLQKKIKVAARYAYFDDEYYQKYCKDLLLNEFVENIGEQDNDGKRALLENAYCNLHPTSFREPFGLTVMEAAYSGTPTLAIKKGSMSELIEEGKTGILVEDFTEGFFKFDRIKDLDRKYIAERAGRMFNYKVMAKQYEKAYENVIKIYKDGIRNDREELNRYLEISKNEIKALYNRLTLPNNS